MPIKQRLDGPMLTRGHAIDASILNADDRRVRLSFSSETPYLRASFFDDPWVEVLGHKDGEVDMRRLNGGAPLLFNHDSRSRENHVGVVERAWLDGGKGYAEVRFSKAADADSIWQRVAEGTLQNVSVGYQIHERSLTTRGEDGPDEYRVTRWSPMEVSIVTVPADSTVGVGRSAATDAVFTITDVQEQNMPSSNKTATGDGGHNPAPDPVAEAVRSVIETPLPVDKDAIRAESTNAERERVAGILKAVRTAQLDNAFADDLIERGVSLGDARAAIIDKWGEQGGPQQQQNRHDGTRVQAGETAAEKFTRGATVWLMSKAGLGKHEADNPFNGYTLRELLRRSLEARDIRTEGMGVEQMLTRAGMHGMSDFPEVVRNVANKALIEGYQESPATHSQWTQVGSLSDFKTAYRVDFGGLDNLREVKRGSEVKYVSTSDGAETIALATYAEKFAIDRQTIIDDDVTAFSRIPGRFGEAAAGTANEIAYGILTANGNMSDGVALFHASHGNLLSAAAILTTSVDTMRVAMATQKRRGVSSDGRAMNINLDRILVPKALEGTALTVRNSQFEVTASGRNNTTPNSQMNRFEVTADALLDDASATAWYGLANRETVEMAFLNGVQTPTLMRIEQTNILGMEWLVYIDIGASALNWRTMAKNPGS